MFKTIVQKELKSIFQSPKFVWTFLTCSILILLSVFIGIQEFNANVKQYSAAIQLNQQEMIESKSWAGLGTKLYRAPDPMQIFVAGIHNDIGRFSNVNSWYEIKLKNSIYSDDPVFAVFRFIDFSFIVLIVLSLFTIVFTYDSINGEREKGTLKLIFANSVPRAKFILAKFVGSSLGLIIPLIVPILLSILLLLLFNIPMSSTHWVKLFSLIFISLLFLVFFIGFGIFISTCAKRSSLSFLLLLMFWIVFVLIIPRVGIMIAGQVIDVPTVAQTESIADSYSRQRWDKLYHEDMEKIWKKREEETKGMTKEEREAYFEKNRSSIDEEHEKFRNEAQKQITEYKKKLLEEVRNKRYEQERLAFLLSRFSPASAYSLAAMNLSGTNINLKTNYEDSFSDYKNTFLDYTEKKQKGSGNQKGNFISISVDDKTVVRISTGDGRKQTLDLKELPQFKDPELSFSSAFAYSLVDIGILSVLAILSFLGSFFVFLRSDLR